MARKSEAAVLRCRLRGRQPRFSNLRTQIDKLDLQILKLVNERASLVRPKSARSRTTTATKSFRRPGKKKSCKNVLQINEKNKGPLDPTTVRAIFREIMSGSRALQKVLKVAYLGPEYSFSHLAAVERFGQAVEFMGVGSIAAVFEEVNRGHVDFGVVPLENSTDGRIADTLDMFMRHAATGDLRRGAAADSSQFAGQLRAAGDSPRLQQAAGAVAVPQLAEQEFAAGAAARSVQHGRRRPSWPRREPGAAAVASRQAAVSYGLRILFADIEDSPHNETRFAVIGHQKCGKTGNDKTAVMFRMPHNPGSLVDALDVFKQNKINLTWIESFPASTAASRSTSSSSISKAISKTRRSQAHLKALSEHCEEVTVLGSFPMADQAVEIVPQFAVVAIRKPQIATPHRSRSELQALSGRYPMIIVLRPDSTERANRPRPGAHPRTGLQTASQPRRTAHHRRRHRRRGQAAGRAAAGHSRASSRCCRS